MNVRSASPDPATQESSAAEKISAYYSLVFPTVTFYVRTLSVTIGRRCIPNPNLATSSAPDNLQVDVDLGALKSVSRLHAKIEYDQEEDRFMLLVVGRNGAWVDGVWSASGTRAPLGERSQIQIASRTFHFVLPPPPPPEDTPSPSSQSSNARARSPSTPSLHLHFRSHKYRRPNPPAAKTNPKKRKKPEPPSPPKPKLQAAPVPAEIPEKPSLTLRQLIQSAIKDLGGKATLQDVCTWIMDNYEHYQHVDDKWMSSVRHTLSSDKHFKKMERCSGTKGKGYFWSIDEGVEDPPTTQPSTGAAGPAAPRPSHPRQEIKPSVPTPAPTAITKEAAAPGPSVAPTLTAPAVPPSSQVTGVFAYSALSSTSSYPGQNPYAALTQGQWSMSSAAPSMSAAPSGPVAATTPAPPPTSSSTVPTAQPAAQTSDVSIPIILSPIPATHPDYAPTHPNNSAKQGYMILHERTLILDPDVFSGLSTERLKELEVMGARKALGVLAEHMLRVLKERRAAARGRGRGRGRGRPPNGRPGPPPPANASGAANAVVSPPAPAPPAPTPAAAAAPGGRADSPLVIIDDSDDELVPAAKRRKVEDVPVAAAVDVPMSVIA
ncbi:hypothetical protein MSAN_01423900 [Mycena sanguinolenta]|uniref:Uncharacterized protein n=1 Tax=Mycena sanguinolenta TaxID=230812 RepID=A0A8H6YB26_9AGAR|nr:hypothetical protein MSAN_01423900 [Mycena sanguinolenta]